MQKLYISHFTLVSQSVRVYLYGGELAWLGGLARLGEMIFILRLYGIFYLSSIKKVAICCWRKIVWSISFYNKQWRKAIMLNKCSYII